MGPLILSHSLLFPFFCRTSFDFFPTARPPPLLSHSPLPPSQLWLYLGKPLSVSLSFFGEGDAECLRWRQRYTTEGVQSGGGGGGGFP